MTIRRFRRALGIHTTLIVLLIGAANLTRADESLRVAALDAALRATAFLTEQVSTQGGYLWRYAADLQLREGEGIVDSDTVWVQPPGTPTVGESFLRLYEATGKQQFLDAARQAAEALRRGQMVSGGWQAMVEFEPVRRRRWAYRVDNSPSKAKDQSSLDDDKTQSALRFVMQLDQALEFKDEKIHEMAGYALDGLLHKGQLPNGGFPQVWTSTRPPLDDRARSASYPNSWPRTYPGHNEYWSRYTLNDNLVRDVIRTLFLAEAIYQQPAYRAAALRTADFLLLAQMPAPQPAWAQQYSFNMQPIWARKFEPPAVTGGESQGVIDALLDVFSRTGDRKYLQPIPRALDYLEDSLLTDGKLARFYELRTNRPLYFTKDYQLTYDDSDMPTHYGFQVASQLPRLRRRYEQLASTIHVQASPPRRRANTVTDDQARRIVNALDARGAWVDAGGLRYHKRPGPVIDMRQTTARLNQLADYLRERN